MPDIKQTIIPLLSIALLISCSTGNEGVWDSYDYTDHTPYYYQQTEDNDDTYVVPYQFGICNDGTNMFGCE